MALSGANPAALIAELQNGADLLNYYDKTEIETMLAASALLDKIKTVDGSGSGLNADKLQGLGKNSSAANWTLVVRNGDGAAQINDLRTGLDEFYLHVGNAGEKIAELGSNDVGSFAMAVPISGGEVTMGTLVDGTTLRPATGDGSTQNGNVNTLNGSYPSSLSGTYRCQGYVRHQTIDGNTYRFATLFIKVLA